MQKNKMKFVSLLAVILLSLPHISFAFSLGPIQVESYLGEPLQAQIRMSSVRSSESAKLNIQLAGAEEYAERGIEQRASHESLNFKLIKGSNNQYYIQVSSSTAITEPFLNFLLKVNSGSNSVTREYAVFLDPNPMAHMPSSSDKVSMVVGEQAKLAPNTPTSNKAQQWGGNDRVISPCSQIPGEPTRAYGTYGPVRAGDTLYSIAKNTRPSEAISIREMINAIRRANASILRSNNPSYLPKGVVLVIPDVMNTCTTTIQHQQQVAPQPNIIQPGGTAPAAAIAFDNQVDPYNQLPQQGAEKKKLVDGEGGAPSDSSQASTAPKEGDKQAELAETPDDSALVDNKAVGAMAALDHTESVDQYLNDTEKTVEVSTQDTSKIDAQTRLAQAPTGGASQQTVGTAKEQGSAKESESPAGVPIETYKPTDDKTTQAAKAPSSEATPTKAIQPVTSEKKSILGLSASQLKIIYLALIALFVIVTGLMIMLKNDKQKELNRLLEVSDRNDEALREFERLQAELEEKERKAQLVASAGASEFISSVDSMQAMEEQEDVYPDDIDLGDLDDEEPDMGTLLSDENVAMLLDSYEESGYIELPSAAKKNAATVDMDNLDFQYDDSVTDNLSNPAEGFSQSFDESLSEASSDDDFAFDFADSAPSHSIPAASSEDSFTFYEIPTRAAQAMSQDDFDFSFGDETASTAQASSDDFSFDAQATAAQKDDFDFSFGDETASVAQASSDDFSFDTQATAAQKDDFDFSFGGETASHAQASSDDFSFDTQATAAQKDDFDFSFDDETASHTQAATPDDFSFDTQATATQKDDFDFSFGDETATYTQAATPDDFSFDTQAMATQKDDFDFSFGDETASYAQAATPDDFSYESLAAQIKKDDFDLSFGTTGSSVNGFDEDHHPEEFDFSFDVNNTNEKKDFAAMMMAKQAKNAARSSVNQDHSWLSFDGRGSTTSSSVSSRPRMDKSYSEHHDYIEVDQDLLAINIDLANSFIATGNKGKAKELLQEVIHQGDDLLRRKAENIIRSM